MTKRIKQYEPLFNLLNKSMQCYLLILKNSINGNGGFIVKKKIDSKIKMMAMVAILYSDQSGITDQIKTSEARNKYFESIMSEFADKYILQGFDKTGNIINITKLDTAFDKAAVTTIIATIVNEKL